MKAKFINEDYPPGAEYDPRAPWNEPDFREFETIDVNQYGEVELIRRNNFEDEKQIIDGNIMNQFLTKELEIDFKLQNVDEKNIGIIEIEKMSNGSYDILTIYGKINVFFEELENLI